MSAAGETEGRDLPGIGFRAARGGGATARFGAAEAVLLRGLVSQVAELIGEGLPGDKGAPGGFPAPEGAPGAAEGAPGTGGGAPGTAERAPGTGGGAPGTAEGAPGAAEGAPGTGGGETGGAENASAATEAAFEEMLGLSSSSRLPDDPILARLFPDAYSDDKKAAGEFRRYTERGLRSGKMAAAQTVLDTLPEAGGRVELSPEQAQAWLRSLNDIRLALGVQLDVTEDMQEMQERAAQAGPQAAGLWIYDWLSVLQESLVHALS